MLTTIALLAGGFVLGIVASVALLLLALAGATLGPVEPQTDDEVRGI